MAICACMQHLSNHASKRVQTLDKHSFSFIYRHIEATSQKLTFPISTSHTEEQHIACIDFHWDFTTNKNR